MTQYHNLVSKVERKSMQEGLLYCSMAFKATKGQNFFAQYFLSLSMSHGYNLVIFGSVFNGVQKHPKTTKLVILVVNWLDNVIATDSDVSLDWVEAATNTFGELAPHLVCVVTGQRSSRRFQ